MEIVVGLIIGLVVGGGFALFFFRQASAAREKSAGLRTDLKNVESALQSLEVAKVNSETQLKERNRQVESLMQERDEFRTQLDTRIEDFTETQSKLSAKEASLAQVEAALKRDRDELATKSRTLETTRKELEEARTELEGIKSSDQTRQEELERRRQELDTHFKGLASDIARSSNDEFRKQAAEDFKRQRELAEQELKQRVEPVGQGLADLKKQIDEMEKRREGAYEGVSELIKSTQQRVDSLSSETGDLREILRSSQLRGNWGERSLENILQLAGMRKDVDYQTQVSTDKGSGRADVVVRMPGGRKIVIDSKVPFEDYRSAMEATEDEPRQAFLESHAANVLKTARELSGAEYADNIDQSLDFVVMWIPSDSILEAATRVRPDLIAETYEKHQVLLATPVTMIALVSGVAEALRQERFHDKANEIQQSAQTLYDGVRRHAEHYARLGRAITRAGKAYDAGVGSLQGDLLVGARRMRDLGGGTEGQDAPVPETLSVSTRMLTHSELRDLNPPEAAD